MEKNKISLKNEFIEQKESVLVSNNSLEKNNKLYNPQDIIELIEHNKNADRLKIKLIDLQLEAHNIIKEAEENIFLTRGNLILKDY